MLWWAAEAEGKISGWERVLTSLSLLDQTAYWSTIAVIALALVALVLLTVVPARDNRRVAIRSALLVALAIGVTVLARWIVEGMWKPYPDTLPPSIWGWIGFGLMGAFLTGGAIATRPHWKRTLASLLAGLLVVVGVAQEINMQFAKFPSVGAIVGARSYDTAPPAQAFAPAGQVLEVPAGTSVDEMLAGDWRAADGSRPERGVVVTVEIPGTRSHFSARPAKVYLPPAYFAEPRPRLPVVVAVAGQPGAPEDWTDSLQMPQVMDAFAAEHKGLAPIVVVPDPIGGRLGNTLCVDSARGNADTYLGQDVPNWVDATLQAAHDRSRWAFAGFSFGGTCALQMSLLHPELYPTFLAMSAQIEPTVGNRQTTIDQYFAGDAAAFAAHNPMDLLAQRTFSQVAGAFVVGEQDAEYRAGVEQLHTAAQQAGIAANLAELPGRHSFSLWRSGLEHYLPWLASRLALTAAS